jgi:hypothetical protein
MTKHTTRVKDCPSIGKTYRIGLVEAIAISRVEGQIMSREIARMFKVFDKEGLSHEVRRADLMVRFGQGAGDQL